MFATGPRRRKGLEFVCLFGHDGHRQHARRGQLKHLHLGLRMKLFVEKAGQPRTRSGCNSIYCFGSHSPVDL